MPGANYMGGRRNIVKARAKDTVSRQQKGHFGRQRLDILARGVSALKPSELAGAKPSAAFMTYKPTAQDIDLAHAHARARTKLPVTGTGSGGDKIQKRYIPSPVHVLPSLCSPRSRASMRAPSAPNRSKTRSAVCDALDMSDSVFMRRIMDEILAMPDLAGLGKLKQKPKSGERPVTMTRSPSVRSAIDNSPGSQSQGPSHSSSKQSSWRRPETPPPRWNSLHDIRSSDYDADFSYHPGASRVRSPSTPHATRVRQYSPDSPGADFEHKTSSSYVVRDTGNSSRQFESVQRSFQDSGFSEYNAGHNPQAVSDSSPSWSTRFNDTYSSPRSIVQSSEVKDDWIEDTRMGEGSDSGFHSDALAIASPASGIPTVIEFGQQGLGQQRSGRRPSVYGTLFEQPDPWHAIGVILGIEEQEEQRDVSAPVPEIDIHGSLDVDVEVPFDIVYDRLSEEEFGAEGASSNVDVEAMSYEEDEEELDSDWDCQFSTWSKGSKDSLVEDWGSTQMGNGLYETTTSERPGSEPMVGLEGENELKMLDVDDDGVELQEASEIEQRRVLEVPALDEVDGKFVGPALFGMDFSSSEDEGPVGSW